MPWNHALTAARRWQRRTFSGGGRRGRLPHHEGQTMNAAERHHARAAAQAMEEARNVKRFMVRDPAHYDVPRARMLLSRYIGDARRHNWQVIRARRLFASDTTGATRRHTTMIRLGATGRAIDPAMHPTSRKSCTVAQSTSSAGLALTS
jgi:hypothetical protein